MTHLRRKGNQKSTAINFNSNTNFLGKQEEFLKNATKHSVLEKEGCPTIICNADADLVIAKTAISLAAKRIVTVIGDVLVLLLHHLQVPNMKLYFRSDKERKKNKISAFKKYLESAYVTLPSSYMHILDVIVYLRFQR